jgi:large subunit ribosomal protein L32e
LKIERKELKKIIITNQKKRKKPDFQRLESWRLKRVKKRWRRPRGLDNHMRRKIKGWPLSPNTGYRSQKIIRGLHPSGFREVRVFNVDDLNGVDPEEEAIKIAHTVGTRKRIEIVKRAKEMGIHILNPREFKELDNLTEKNS